MIAILFAAYLALERLRIRAVMDHHIMIIIESLATELTHEGLIRGMDHLMVLPGQFPLENFIADFAGKFPIAFISSQRNHIFE